MTIRLPTDKGNAFHHEGHSNVATILDSLDAMVYVSDMQTNEVLYVNEYGRAIWGDVLGKTCWKVLQSNQDSPCDFCTNDRLVDSCGLSKKAYIWEFCNTVNNRWYQCRDQAIRWDDGRLVRLEIATDITDRKRMEVELEAAKKQAESLARKDALTGLGNRREFFERGTHAFEQSTRFDHDISLVMMDIDHFKSINDRYGHSVGDKVLKALAHPIQKTARDIDIVARMGGEEFAFILPKTGLEDAAILAERLRREVEELEVTVDRGKIGVTASFGVVARQDGSISIEALLRRADDALYLAKKRGRNQISVCDCGGASD